LILGATVYRGFMRFVAVLVVALSACADHDADLEREGGSIPEHDSGAMPEDDGEIETVTWCQASAVLEQACERCHTEPPANGAPFPLVSYEDTQAPYYSSGKQIWEVMRSVVRSGFMPMRPAALMPPVEPLTCEQKSTLLGWLDQGAKLEGPPTCTDADKVLTAVDERLAECGD
jgi:hypothetical protein